MTADFIIQLGTILIALLGALVTYFVIPYLKTKTTKEQRDNIAAWVQFAVEAAEQLDKAGLITIPKKEFVVTFLNEKGFAITEEQLDVLIEAAVHELNKNK